jgi:hypothetical protein
VGHAPQEAVSIHATERASFKFPISKSHRRETFSWQSNVVGEILTTSFVVLEVCLHSSCGLSRMCYDFPVPLRLPSRPPSPNLIYAFVPPPYIPVRTISMAQLSIRSARKLSGSSAQYLMFGQLLDNVWTHHVACNIGMLLLARCRYYLLL